LKERFFDCAETKGEIIVAQWENGIIKEFRDNDNIDINETIQTLAMTTNYRMNEFIDKATLAMFAQMRVRNPRRYHVAGLGNWGIVEGVIYENWREEKFNVDDIRKRKNIASVFGLDFGYTNDPSALFCGLIDIKNKQLWVFDEMYEYGMSNERIAEVIAEMGYAKERIIADSSEPKSIARLEMLGIYNIRKSRKGKDSVKVGIDYLQGFEMIIHPQCVNFLTEISNYTWDEDKTGRKINKPIDNFNHIMDAMRYAVEGYSRPASMSFDT
jgi:phage terminase large subunit